MSSAALAAALGAAGGAVKLVVLNACHSAAHAAALRGHVDCVIAMAGAIADRAARSFAIGFYGGLGEREAVGAAFRQGRAAIRLGGHAGEPVLAVRDGADADQLVLA